MSIDITLHLWMLVPLCTTAASFLFAWSVWRDDGNWQDSLGLGALLWMFTTLPILLTVALK